MANRFRVGGPNSKYAEPESNPAGFWVGIWHGIIAPIVLLVSIFTPKVRIYETHNRGRLYDFGFLIGAMLIFGGSRANPPRKKLPDAASSVATDTSSLV